MDTRDIEIKNYLFSPLNNNELILIFLEAKEIIPQKISEYKSQREELISVMKNFRKSIKEIANVNNFDSFFIWFWGGHI